MSTVIPFSCGCQFVNGHLTIALPTWPKQHFEKSEPAAARASELLSDAVTATRILGRSPKVCPVDVWPEILAADLALRSLVDLDAQVRSEPLVRTDSLS